MESDAFAAGLGINTVYSATGRVLDTIVFYLFFFGVFIFGIQACPESPVAVVVTLYFYI